ncbi:MAG: RNA polymerase sigma factor [Thermoanaerobaculia bacterium]|nr:RNA polymerase sigma factor [Thermoanaerobaculia bacterium]
MDRSESTTLVQRARAGSTTALDALLGNYGERLLAVIRLRLGRQLRREVESRDVLQNTLLKAFERIDQFEGSGADTFMGWLVAIAQNEIVDQADYYRRLCRDQRLRQSIRTGWDLPARQLHGEISRIALAEETRRLEDAIESLTEDHREVILLRQFEELGFREVGERMGRSEDAARMLFARAMTALSVEMRKRREESF